MFVKSKETGLILIFLDFTFMVWEWKVFCLSLTGRAIEEETMYLQYVKKMHNLAWLL